MAPLATIKEEPVEMMKRLARKRSATNKSRLNAFELSLLEDEVISLDDSTLSPSAHK